MKIVNKIVMKINNIPKPLIASIVYMLVIFFQSGVNLITTPVFSRMLSTKEYGITTTYQSWYNIIGIFVTLNLYAGVYNNALIDFDKDRKKVTSSFLSVSIIISFFTYIIYILLKKQICDWIGLNEWLLNFMFLNFLTYPAWGLFLAQQKFDYKYVKPLIMTIITFILNPIIGIIGIILFPNNKAVAKVIASGLPSLILNFGLLIYILKEGKCFFNKKYWRYALCFNIPLIPHYLSNVILAQSDRIMIQKMVSFSAAGIYSVSYNLSQVLQGIYTGINSAWIPFTYKSMRINDYKKIGRYSNILISFIVIISILLVICAPEIIKILASEEYYEAVWVIPPIVLGLYFSFLTSFFGNIEFYYKKNIFVTIGTTGAAILNIILNYIYIPKFGLVAAGYTTAIGYITLAIAHYIFMKKIKSEAIYDSIYIFKISIFLIIITFMITLLYNYFWIRYTLIIIILIICVINYKRILSCIKNVMKEIKCR